MEMDPKRWFGRFAISPLAWCMVLHAGLAQDPAAPNDPAAFYRNQVKPILVKNCFTCHGPQPVVKGGLRLGSQGDLIKGGDSGPAIDWEQPSASLLLSAVRYESLEMPPKGQLSAREIDVLARWVELGAPYDPREEVRASAGTAHEPAVTAEARQFWSFRPVVRPEVPQVADGAWVRTPIDAFIRAKLEAEGLEPVPPADKPALLRRAYYDLLGLPPTPAEVAAFVADDDPRAFERVVDRLLDSPHYGERWARHWLDLVRYAETNSFERDGAKPFVWRYRDYVIQAFNADQPYDQFIREQLAGDELDEPSPEAIVATGFYRLGAWDDEPSDPEQALYDDLDDLLTTTCQVFLGLTINCARCHDHKLDPIPQADYYRLLAFLRNVRRYGVRSHESVLDASVRVIASPEEQRVHAEAVRVHRQQLEEVNAQLAALEAVIMPTFSEVEKQEFQHRQSRVPLARKRVPDILPVGQFDEYARLTERRDELERHPPQGLDQALCVKEHGVQPPETRVLLRGNPHVPGDAVEPGFPEVLSPPAPRIAPRAESSGRRLALANWIASAENPLTARVLVNRVWQYHFGRGIVRSPSNFGQIGDRPTHPELLDWLASEFVRGGWRLKDLHRLIMRSNTYQLSSRASAEALAKDPENHGFWRFDMRRLSAEELRDSILAANGTLNLAKIGGPSIYPVIPDEVLHTQSQPGSGWGKSTPEERSRRSIYIHLKRSLLTPLLASFDAADPDASCPVRFTTTLPTQALSMLNSDFLQEESGVLAACARRAAGAEPAEQVRYVLRRVLQREVTDQQVQRGLDLLARLKDEDGVTDGEALTHFCLVALNLNEFIYLD